ncbi:MgtC/SapB family protein [Pseudomonadota bacterium]
MFEITPFNWQDIITCILCGSVLGIERQLRGKPVGLRTATLITIGTYCFIALGVSLSDNRGDHARVMAQVITGIGFLGAGVMMTRDGQIHGVTSAAVIWLLAALGVTIGLGYGQTALILTVLILTVLLGVDKLENSILALRKGVHVHISRRLQHRRKKVTEINGEPNPELDEKI